VLTRELPGNLKLPSNSGSQSGQQGPVTVQGLAQTLLRESIKAAKDNKNGARYRFRANESATLKVKRPADEFGPTQCFIIDPEHGVTVDRFGLVPFETWNEAACEKKEDSGNDKTGNIKMEEILFSQFRPHLKQFAAQAEVDELNGERSVGAGKFTRVSCFHGERSVGAYRKFTRVSLIQSYIGSSSCIVILSSSFNIRLNIIYSLNIYSLNIYSLTISFSS
jgi:hypothetical protein